MEKGVVRFFGDPAPIQRDYLVDDFRRDIGELPVVASVHVQFGVAPGDEAEETRWLQKQIATSGLPSAIVAFCDLTAPDLAAMLDDHRQAEALRGIRQIIGRSVTEDRRTGSAGLLDDSRFIAGLRILAERDLTFDLQLIPEQMERASRLFSMVPDLRVALCHAGSLSDFSPEGRALWHRGICQLSALPNAICKVSGFGMFDKNWSAQSVRPQFDALLAAFGPGRMAFGSNFPVDKLAMSYAQLWQRYFELADWLSADEQSQLFHDTATRFYKLSNGP
jgi:predicted TIM-barrel fold metal-dependent hydrolase